MMLIRTSKLGCRALIEIAFESISVHRQVGYLTRKSNRPTMLHVDGTLEGGLQFQDLLHVMQVSHD